MGEGSWGKGEGSGGKGRGKWGIRGGKWGKGGGKWGVPTPLSIPSTCDIVLREHYENTPIQIYRKFHLPKLKKNQIKNSDVLSRLWILVRIASARRFLVPTIYVFERK